MRSFASVKLRSGIRGNAGPRCAWARPWGRPDKPASPANAWAAPDIFGQETLA